MSVTNDFCDGPSGAEHYSNNEATRVYTSTQYEVAEPSWRGGCGFVWTINPRLVMGRIFIGSATFSRGVHRPHNNYDSLWSRRYSSKTEWRGFVFLVRLPSACLVRRVAKVTA